jgi:hypothetical protein
MWPRASRTPLVIPGEFSASQRVRLSVTAFDKNVPCLLIGRAPHYPTLDAWAGGASQRGWIVCSARQKTSAPCHGGISGMSTYDKKLKKISAVILALISVSVVCSVAGAQQPSQAQISAVRSSCRSDYMAHCSSVPSGGKASLACLQKNIASLSQACKTAVNAIGGGQGAAPTPAQPTPAQPAAAPAESAPTVSAPSAPAATPSAPVTAAPSAPVYPAMSPRQELRVLRWSCGPDYRALCGGVPIGGGRVAACLRANGPSLSPRCRRALMGAMR